MKFSFRTSHNNINNSNNKTTSNFDESFHTPAFLHSPHSTGRNRGKLMTGKTRKMSFIKDTSDVSQAINVSDGHEEEYPETSIQSIQHYSEKKIQDCDVLVLDSETDDQTVLDVLDAFEEVVEAGCEIKSKEKGEGGGEGERDHFHQKMDRRRSGLFTPPKLKIATSNNQNLYNQSLNDNITDNNFVNPNIITSSPFPIPSSDAFTNLQDNNNSKNDINNKNKNNVKNDTTNNKNNNNGYSNHVKSDNENKTTPRTKLFENKNSSVIIPESPLENYCFGGKEKIPQITSMKRSLSYDYDFVGESDEGEDFSIVIPETDIGNCQTYLDDDDDDDDGGGDDGNDGGNGYDGDYNHFDANLEEDNQIKIGKKKSKKRLCFSDDDDSDYEAKAHKTLVNQDFIDTVIEEYDIDEDGEENDHQMDPVQVVNNFEYEYDDEDEFYNCDYQQLSDAIKDPCITVVESSSSSDNNGPVKENHNSKIESREESSSSTSTRCRKSEITVSKYFNDKVEDRVDDIDDRFDDRVDDRVDDDDEVSAFTSFLSYYERNEPLSPLKGHLSISDIMSGPKYQNQFPDLVYLIKRIDCHANNGTGDVSGNSSGKRNGLKDPEEYVQMLHEKAEIRRAKSQAKSGNFTKSFRGGRRSRFGRKRGRGTG